MNRIEEFDGRCAYCFAKTEFPDMDHIVPLAKGGSHDISNIVPACAWCNGSKKDRDLVEWLDITRGPDSIAAQEQGEPAA